MMPYPYTFVTVSYANEYGLLRLHARSMATHCPSCLVGEILVIENFDVGLEMGWRKELLAEYGCLAAYVRFVRTREIADLDMAADGWWRQQVCKLTVSIIVRTPRYVILDTKNILMQRLTRTFLETLSGQPRLNAYSYANHPLKEALVRTLSYLGVEPLSVIPRFARTTTPFTIVTDVARNLISYVEEKENRRFGLAFLDLKLTEFFLYSGYLLKCGLLWELYDFTQPLCAQIWNDDANEGRVRWVVKTGGTQGECPFIAVHRKALNSMPDISRLILSESWRNQGFFPTIDDGIRFTYAPGDTSGEATGKQVATQPII